MHLILYLHFAFYTNKRIIYKANTTILKAYFAVLYNILAFKKTINKEQINSDESKNSKVISHKKYN